MESKTPYTDATNCKKKSTNGHIKRPMNSFMIFAQRERLRISTMSEKPLHNAVISKMCGAKWRSMTAEEKKPYEDLAQDYKMRHSVQYPFYVYKPKKK
ncbi:hypothetical protein HELRODRAFT_70896, partial [Helobdella robusta]|uniref:Sex-determining region Y protein n=1 Tax=Helobdella robusta TaxID=6412 RepID=T1G0D9_HELRO